jgi:hypothetical protein
MRSTSYTRDLHVRSDKYVIMRKMMTNMCIDEDNSRESCDIALSDPVVFPR